jgi:hypothetical protein
MTKAQDKELRGLAAEMADLEPEMAKLLISDASPEVRERLASHTQDAEVISALLRDRTVRVRKGLAVNQRTNPEQRHQLAEDSSPDVRAALVRAVALDESDLRAMLNDRSVDVRRALATSEFTPAEIRQELEKDEDEAVAEDARRLRGAEVPATPRVGHQRPISRRFPGKSGK